MNGPLTLHRATVVPAWIDYNGHMTEGFYAVVFADASDALLLHIGFDETYRREHRGSFYTVETHIRFLRELDEGASIEVATRVLGVDPKRLHLYQEMIDVDTSSVAATQETMLLHVDLEQGKVVPMDDTLLRAARAIAERHRALPPPDAVGRGIRPVRSVE